MSTHTPSVSSAPLASGPNPTRRPSRTTVIAAVAAPLLVAGQFAMVAVLPVTVALVSAFAMRESRATRFWAIVLGAAYAVPFLRYLTDPDRPRSLSASLDLYSTTAILAAGVALLVTLYRAHRASTSR
jgi:hypothetical protein